MLANSVLLKTEEKQTELYWEDCLKADVQQITPLGIQLENTRKLSTKSNCDDARLFKLSRLKRRRNSRFFHSPLGVRRTVKSSTSIVAVVAGSLHSNEKSLSAELRRYQGFGVDVTLLHLGFNVTDFNSLPLITNDLME